MDTYGSGYKEYMQAKNSTDYGKLESKHEDDENEMLKDLREQCLRNKGYY